MDEFKLKSIDEFDSNFVTNARVESRSAAPKAAHDNLIPEMDFSQSIDSEQAPAQDNYQPAFVPEQPVERPRTPRPLEPIGQTPSPYAVMNKENSAPAPLVLNEDEMEDKEEGKKSGSGKGLLAGKIISIVMLVVTVITFLIGCFSATFLDTFELGSICLSTQNQDLENFNISKGALIISKKLESSEYAVNQNVVVPVTVIEGSEEKTYANICGINGVTALGDTVELSVYDYATETQQPLLANDCKGEVMFYIPALAGILNFALQADNAILVCALFVLLAAFWCLLIVFLSKAAKKNNEE